MAVKGAVGFRRSFVGTDTAADRLAELPVWKTARVIKAVLDRGQFPARMRALAEGELAYMAVPSQIP